jgi:hypothetical protein
MKKMKFSLKMKVLGNFLKFSLKMKLLYVNTKQEKNMKGVLNFIY